MLRTETFRAAGWPIERAFVLPSCSWRASPCSATAHPFSVLSCTLTAVSHLATLGHARVVPFVTEVLPNYQGYKSTIFKPLTDFPSGSDVVDAPPMNEFLEEQILKLPEQSYWVHRRFKHRPPGMPGVY